MAILAETPSHGRLPKNLNTKLVKLFPPGLLVYTTEKPPRFRGWNALVSLIIVAYFITFSPTPPSRSFVLLLSSVACSIPLGHWRHALETVWVDSMNSYSAIRTLVLCGEVSPVVMPPVYRCSPRFILTVIVHQCVSLSCVMLVAYWGKRPRPITFFFFWCHWCKELCGVYVLARNMSLITLSKWRFWTFLHCQCSPQSSTQHPLSPFSFIHFGGC